MKFTVFTIVLLQSVRAQISQTAQTAGIEPTPDSPQFPSGLNGLSTGSTAGFTALGTGPIPNGVPTPTVTLTGAELSAFEASIATNFAQASGSQFAYTSTTGNMISGVAATLSGGYNEVTPVLPSTSGSLSSTNNNGATSLSVRSDYLSYACMALGMVGGAVWIL